MRIEFPYYANIAGLDIPDENLLGVYQPPVSAPPRPAAEIIEQAFANPIGSPPICDLAAGKRRVLILTDDYTRKTPVKKILDRLIPEMESAGVRREDITIMVALGTHRPMTDDERTTKFGEGICRTLKIVDHDWQDEANLVDYGVTDSGTPVRVNRAVQDADLILGIGQILPHRIAGFSGGAKIIQPGICGAETTAETHWRSALYSGAEILGVADNPVRREIEQVAQRVGLAAIANAVCDSDGNLLGMFVGHPVAAHRAGAELSRKVYGVAIPEPVDILVIDSYPMDIELWQGAKALYAGELAIKKGGVSILVTPCPEGISKTHGLILKEGYRRSHDTISMVESGRITDKIVAAHLVRVGRVIRDNGIGILVSPGIGCADTEQLGFRYASDAQAALGMAFEIKGRNASVLVMKHGGTSLPIVGSS